MLGTALVVHAEAHANESLIKVLQERSCEGCRLADADLVHADLRDANLRNAQLMRANLSQAQLDGADLTGSNLYGTDLRDADLSGARLSPQALEEAHWQGAQGISNGSRSHAALHNAGVEAFQADRWSEAEQLFSDAIRSAHNEPLSWVARGISRSEQAKDDLAASDFRYAGSLYQARGSQEWANQLTAAADSVSKRRFESDTPNEGKGMGGQFLEGTMAGLRMLAPIAAKALVPLGLGF
jgi:hypothetical protein